MSLRKRIAPLLAGVLVLSGCAAPAAETPMPTPEGAETLAPTPTPEPTPEPAEEVTELWGFPIDETHDAFEVPTGGRLGTVLVTVEWGFEDSKNKRFEVYASDDLREPIQTMEMNDEWLHLGQVEDVNFDGYMDFMYISSAGAANEFFALWIWDEEQTRFCEGGEWLVNPVFDTETEIVSTYMHYSVFSGVQCHSHWENGELVVLRRIVTHQPEPKEGKETQLLTVEDRINGELTEVYRKSFVGNEVDTIYEAAACWDDLNYHGEDIETLWGFPIDDTHDAFEVPTGGRLGTVLVTVELVENEKAEFRRELQFAVWTAGDLEKPIQTMTAEWVSAFHWMDIRDANFDGYIDFGYMFAMGNHPAYYHYWIWDEKQGIFVSEPEFDQISVPEFDEETGIISGYSRDGDAGASGTYTFHQWKGGKLVCIRRIRTLAYGTRIRVTVEEPVDGVLTEILRLETDIETAFDEVEKWQDLNYHGE